MTVFGILRVKNEARWIADVILAMLGICDRIFVLDDHSTDETPDICERFDKVSVTRSPYVGLDESRDKNFLLQQVLRGVPPDHLTGDERSPCWVLAIDGDEVLDSKAATAITAVLSTTTAHAFRLPVRYLWDSDLSTPKIKRIRVDGVYQHFARPSLFRVFRSDFIFMQTPWGGNLHCSSIPQQLLHLAQATIETAPLWHLGYNDRADRLRKFNWYNTVDPHNEGEDEYRHCIQGDVPEIPAAAYLRHAGPLRLVTIEDSKCSAA